MHKNDYPVRRQPGDEPGQDLEAMLERMMRADMKQAGEERNKAANTFVGLCREQQEKVQTAAQLLKDELDKSEFRTFSVTVLLALLINRVMKTPHVTLADWINCINGHTQLMALKAEEQGISVRDFVAKDPDVLQTIAEFIVREQTFLPGEDQSSIIIPGK